MHATTHPGCRLPASLHECDALRCAACTVQQLCTSLWSPTRTFWRSAMSHRASPVSSLRPAASCPTVSSAATSAAVTHRSPGMRSTTCSGCPQHRMSLRTLTAHPAATQVNERPRSCGIECRR